VNGQVEKRGVEEPEEEQEEAYEYELSDGGPSEDESGGEERALAECEAGVGDALSPTVRRALRKNPRWADS
jgi:hypothetical protein